MKFLTTEQLQHDRTAMRKSIHDLTQRLNQMDAVTRERATKTILNLRGQVEAITEQLNMAGAA